MTGGEKRSSFLSCSGGRTLSHEVLFKSFSVFNIRSKYMKLSRLSPARGDSTRRRQTFVLCATTFVQFSPRRRCRILVCVEEPRMKRYQAYDVDNRNSEQMYEYLESRIDALKRRISELEMENARLRFEDMDSREQLVELVSA